MADGGIILDDPTLDIPVEPVAARGLTYPLGAIPEPGEAIEAAPGVLWLRMPLPMALNHVNVYAIEDDGGWAVVDTGLRTPDTIQAWEAALAGPLGGRPVTRVIATHMHPDHIGLAGWLVERFDTPFLMTRLEYVFARMLIAETGPGPESGARFFHAAGWDEARIEKWRGSYGMFSKGVAPLPPSYSRLSEGDALSIGGDDWTILIGDGHSPEHACLWRKSDGVLISGDQLLPKISSNVSVWPTEPMADPLGDWMRSLDKMEQTLPADTFCLPGHGEPFMGVLPRVQALRRGHEVALKRLERTLRTPSRAVDVFPALFARPVGDGLFGMATGEAIAHLHYLERRGRAQRTPDAEGVDWWTLTPKEIEA